MNPGDGEDLPTAKPLLSADLILAAIEAEMAGHPLTEEQARALRAFEVVGDFAPAPPTP